MTDSPFWWRKSVSPETAPGAIWGIPASGTKPGERGYDQAADVRADMEVLKELYRNSGNVKTRRIARTSLEPLLLGQGMSPYDFGRQFPEIDPAPMPVEEAQDNLQKITKMFDFMNRIFKPQR
jgi:hypothetical protein